MRNKCRIWVIWQNTLVNTVALVKKLIYAVWGLDEINGRLYGKIDCYLHFALNEEEIEDLRKAIIGQNSGR